MYHSFDTRLSLDHNTYLWSYIVGSGTIEKGLQKSERRLLKGLATTFDDMRPYLDHWSSLSDMLDKSVTRLVEVEEQVL